MIKTFNREVLEGMLLLNTVLSFYSLLSHSHYSYSFLPVIFYVNLHLNTSQRTWHYQILSILILISLYTKNHWCFLICAMAERYCSNFLIILLRTCWLKMVLRLCLRKWAWILSLHGSYSFIHEPKQWYQNAIKNEWLLICLCDCYGI